MKKKLLALLLTLCLVLGLFPIGVLAAPAEPGAVEATKTATYDPETDEVTITLSVQGKDAETSQAEKKPVDVVLVVDNSSSMSEGAMPCTSQEYDRPWWGFGGWVCTNCGKYYSLFDNPTGKQCEGETSRISAAKKSAYALMNALQETSTQNKLAVVGFQGQINGGTGKNHLNSASCWSLTLLDEDNKENVNGLTKAISDMRAIFGGGTNYTAALDKAYQYIQEFNEDGNDKYVIFISDGDPRYNETIGSSEDTKWNGVNQANALKEDFDAKIYAIGLGMETDTALKQIASGDDYVTNLRSEEDINIQLPALIEEIVTEIVPDTKPAGTEAVFTDVISENFVWAGWTDAENPPTNAWCDETTRTVTWNIGEITETNQTISFKVKPANPGVYGKISTSAGNGAVLDYKDHKDQEQTITDDDPLDISSVELIYDLNNGRAPEGNENAFDKVTIRKNAECTVSAVTPERDSFTFTGWKGSDGKEYGVGQEIEKLTNNIELTAQWKKDTQDITFTYKAGENGALEATDGSEEALTVTETVTVATGESAHPTNVPKAVPNTGYMFAGWRVDGEATLLTTEALKDKSFASDATFTAVFKEDKNGDGTADEDQIFVKYEAGEGGSLNEGAITEQVFDVNENDTYGLIIPSYTTDYRYVYSGLSVDQGANIDDNLNLTNVNGGQTYTVTLNFRLTDAKMVTFTYEAGEHGSLNGAVSEKVTVFGPKGAYPTNVPTPVAAEGYEFAGWQVGENPEGEVTLLSSDELKTMPFAQNTTFVAVFEEDPEAGKTLRIHWAIDNADAASWELYDGNARTETIAWSDRDNTFVMPKVVVKDGYHLAGWSVSGTQSNYWDANTYEFGLTGLIVEDDKGGYVSITANIVSDEPEDPNAGKTLKIYWGIDNPDAASWKLFNNSSWTETIAWSDRGNTFVMPEVIVKEGYHLAGWSVSGTQGNYWDADTQTFGLNGLIVEDDEGGYVSITANIVSDEPEDPNAGKTLKIYWGIDNPDAASWKLFANSSWTETIAWSDRGNTFVMPEVVVEEGYHLAGWSVSGARGEYWDADTQTFGLNGLIVEDDEGGYVSITANIVSDEPEDPDAGKTLKIYWAIDNPDAASWKLFANSSWTETIAWSDRGNTFVMPEVVVEEGYHLAGWSVSGARGEYWDADTQTFDLDDLIVEDDEGGYVSITANIVKDVPATYTVTLVNEGRYAYGEGSYKAGETVTVYAGTKVGYSFDKWTSGDISITRPYSSKITFTMPAHDVVVKANWDRAGSVLPSLPDVPDDTTPNWLNLDDHDAYIQGYPDGFVKPQNNITRAEVATIFFRLLTDEAREYFWSTDSGFSDVKSSDWFNNAVSTMVNAGVITGYNDGTFRPNDPITRAEFATIAARFLSDPYSLQDQFYDTEGHWAEVYINRAAEVGWINGYNDGSFRPNKAITRAEAVTLVNNVLGREPHADYMLDDMITWPDNPKSAWYYEDIQEATNSHDYRWSSGKRYEIWTSLN